MNSKRSPSAGRASKWLFTLGVLALLAGVYLYVQKSGGPIAISSKGPVLFAPSFPERVDKAISKARGASLGTEARKELESFSGAMLIDAPEKVSGLAEDIEARILLEDPALRELLLANDETAVADAMWEAGVRGVMVHWRLHSTVDRNGTVLARLFHHDGLNRFQLKRVTDELLIYHVLEQPVVFPPQLAAGCIVALRSLLQSNQMPSFGDLKAREGRWELMASVRGQGRELAVGLAKHKDIHQALAELARDIERGHRRYAEWNGFPPIREHIKDLTIEVHRITERAAVEPRGERDLEDLWEMGIDGAIIRDYENRKVGVFPGAASYTRAIRSADSFLRNTASFHRMDSKRPWRDNAIVLEMVRDHHFRELKDGGIVYLYRGVPPVPMAQVTLENTRQSILSAADWWLTNMKPDGSVVYKWWPAENRESNEYNIVRHTLATWNLALAWRLDPRPEYIEGAIKSQEFTLKYLQEEGEMAFFSFNDNQKLGTVVVALLGMIEVARITEDHSNDALMRELANFTLYMQEDNGKFRPYYVDPDHPYYNQVNDIVPGEAALALVELSKYFDDPGYIKPLEKYWEYYKPWYYERANQKRPDAPWPANVYDNNTRLELVQFGPWTVMAANAYYEVTGDKDVAAFGLEIARFMIDSYQWNEERAPFPDYIGGYYKLPYELPAMQAFCYAEGTAAAYQLALQYDPEQAPYFEKASRETVRFGMQMQFDDLNTYAFTRPDMAHGGIRYAMNETKVRIDYTHHALSAMYIYYVGAMKDPNLPEQVKASTPTLGEQLQAAKAAAEARRAEQEAAAVEASEGAAGEAVPGRKLVHDPARLKIAAPAGE